jgi:hypothetical protein
VPEFWETKSTYQMWHLVSSSAGRCFLGETQYTRVGVSRAFIVNIMGQDALGSISARETKLLILSCSRDGKCSWS